MLTAFVFGGFGLIVGSFLNVLILRWDIRPLSGRSSCRACGKTINWYDLIPVVSWIILRGRCRFCTERISPQYVLVEICTAITFLIIGLSPLLLTLRIMALPIAALLVAIAVYDLLHTLIPDYWVYTLAGLSLIVSLYSVFIGISLEQLLIIILAGPGVALPLFALWFVSRGAWMGFGDVKLALAMGWLLGLVGGLEALLLGFVLGAAVSVPLLFFSTPLWIRLQKHFTPTMASLKIFSGFTMKSEIPFGPFLVAATCIVWFSNMYGVVLIDFLL